MFDIAFESLRNSEKLKLILGSEIQGHYNENVPKILDIVKNLKGMPS